MMSHQDHAHVLRPIEIEADQRSLRRVRVFLAENDRDLRHLHARILRDDGYEVVESSDGSELLEQLASAVLDDVPLGPYDVDVIVSDVFMPACAGINVLAGLRGASWRTPVILMTRFPDPRLRARARRLGVTALLRKPIDLDRLREALESVAPPC